MIDKKIIGSFEDFKKDDGVLSKESLILAHYININGLSQEQIDYKIGHYIALNKIKNTDDVFHYIIPTTSESKIECINHGKEPKEKLSKDNIGFGNKPKN